MFQRLLGGGGGELAVDAGMFPAAGVGHEAAEVEILDLGGEVRRKALGVEAADRPDAAAAFQLGGEHGVHAVAQRRDRAHAGDDNASSHSKIRSVEVIVAISRKHRPAAHWPIWVKLTLTT